MTALQLNAELYRNLGIIAEDQTMLAKVAKYARKLVKQMTDDPTCMSKEEYEAMLETRRAEYDMGHYRTFSTIGELDQFVRSL